MNRVQLVQAIVVIAAVMLGYQMVNSLVRFIEGIIHDLPEAGYGRSNFEFRISTLLPGVLFLGYGISLFLLLRFAHEITLFIIDKVGIDDSLNVNFSDKSIICAIVLFLVFNSLIKDIPNIILESTIMIQENLEEHDPNAMWHPDADIYTMLKLFAQIIFCVAILIKIKPVVNFFHRKINPTDPYIITITGNKEEA